MASPREGRRDNVNEPKLEIMTTPDTRVPGCKLPNDVLILEDGSVVLWIESQHVPALRKHLNEGMEEVSVYAGKARTRGRIWSECSPDAKSAVHILVPAEQGE